MRGLWRGLFGGRSGTPADVVEEPAAEVVPEAVEWRSGEVVAGLYRVEGVLGTGGMGQVHLVRHLGWNRDLAVKSPRPELWGGAEAFFDEARVWVDLAPHPHVCACHYVRVLGGVPLIFTEFAENGSVADALRDGRVVTTADVLDIAIQMAWGLRAAHEAGVVHQDVKPANVLLSADGRAMLTDFGLARARARAAEGLDVPGESILVTHGGMTPAYASPEQVAGQRVGRRSDIYSWAVSVLELFIGEVVWLSGPSAAKVLRAAVGGADGTGLAIPGPVADLLAECLSADPDDRPPGMADVAARLIDAYPSVIGRPYPRSAATTATLMADGWNNKALSMLDLDRRSEAELCWQRALENDPRHPDATFNRGLARWRAGAVSDAGLLGELAVVRAAHPGDDRPAYLQGLVHLERGDVRSAAEVLAEAARQAPHDPAITDAVRAAEAQPVPPGLTLAGHGSRGVLSLAVTPDGRYAVSGGWDGKLRKWDLATGDCLATIDSGNENVVFAAITPDARFTLCSGGLGREPGWWDLRGGRLVSRLRGHTEMIDAAAVTSDGRHAVTTSRDKTLRLWRLPRGRCRRVLTGHTEWVLSVAVTADGRFALSGSRDTTLRWWDLATGRCLDVLTGHTGWVQAVAVSADGRLGLSGGTDGTVRLWDLTTGRCLRVLEGGHGDSVQSVAISADGRYGLSGAVGHTVCWWDLTAGRCLRTFTTPRRDVRVVALAGSDRALVGYGDGATDVFGLAAGEAAPWSYSVPSAADVLAARQATFREHLSRARRSVESRDFAGTAAALRAAEAVPGFARNADVVDLWRRIGPSGTRTGIRDTRLLLTLGGDEIGHLTGAALTADGRFALSAGWDNRVRLWDLTTRECVREFAGRGPVLDRPSEALGGRRNLYTVEAVAITPDGRFGVAASREGAIQTWDLTSGEELPPLIGHNSADAVAITPDGRRVLSGGLDRSVRLWDPTTGRCLHVLTGHTSTVQGVAITPDGRVGVSGGWDHEIRVWELASGRCRHVLTGPEEPVTAVAVTPDGRGALVGGWEREARWYDLSSGRCVHVLAGHTRQITSVAVTPDGRHGLTAAGDGTMRWWDLNTGTCLRDIPLTGHVGPVSTVSPTPDAGLALSAGWDGTLRLWQFDWDFDFRRA
ncbi:serine/threonine-protein kinase [Saccharothrix deserti]|uniref:serine/threonine-protein kinase n=1 Tax=Saccharothrix deserti TaxID=2593674 RepID=UPI00131BD91C|nr:serine/threonine-protein kinase [Saccharothrix deserti]